MSTAPSTDWPAVAVMFAGAFMAILDSFIVIVAGPAIQNDLDVSARELQWILAAYQLTYAVFLITGGRLGDIYGRRGIFCIGLALFTAASVLCATSPTATWLISARLFQGVGAALMLPQVFASMLVLVDEADRNRAFGRLGVVIGVATIGGQVIGGALIGADLLGSGWRPVFWVNVPIGLAALVFAVRRVPESRSPAAPRLDLPGLVVLSVALFLLVLPLVEGHQAGWSWWTWTSFAASALALALFVVIEQRISVGGGSPLVRLSLFRAGPFTVGLSLVLTLYAMLTSYYLVLSVALQEGLGLSALEAGLVYTPAAVTFVIFGLIASRLVPRHGRRVLETGALILAAGYASTAAALAGGLPFTAAVVIPTLVLQSVGGGLLITPALKVVLARVAPSDVGVASGVLSTAQQIGAALGVALIGLVFFARFTPSPSGDASVAAADALACASLATCCAALVAAALVFALPTDARSARKHRRERDVVSAPAAPPTPRPFETR